jgi:superfamily II DNA or RNA helicase
MMNNLNSLPLKASYNKVEDDIAASFYLPCMAAATEYDRISGYFGSTIYIIAWGALKQFISNGGRMRIACSPYVSDADARALSEGYSARNNAKLIESLREEVDALFQSPILSAPTRLLACLVAEGIIDVKVAVPADYLSPDARRLFHDKVGVFRNAEGDLVGFRGSMNETFKGLASDGNIESIDVFPSWLDSRDRERVNSAVEFFDRLWRKESPDIAVFDFPDEIIEALRERAKGSDWKTLLDEIDATEKASNKWKPSKRPGGKKPREHQTEALENWLKNERRGVLEHATGSGKTFTAICAIYDALNRGETPLILVPSRELLRQWKTELDDALAESLPRYLMCGDGNIRWRDSGMLHSWTAKSAVDDRRIIIATMDTAAMPEFIEAITQGSHIFLVADEVHRLGSEHRRRIFNLDTGARLGLSATPHRYGDPVGTEAILTYFSGIVPPPFTLSDAIAAGVLTRYFYHPQKLSLTTTEQDEWNEITEDVRKIVARSGRNSDDFASFAMTSRLKHLLIARARIVKNAAGKVPLALSILRNHFRKGDKWIVYCDNINQLKEILRAARAAGFDAYEYYADMVGDREMTLYYFGANGGVLVSIRCLDEGVDIPSTTHALILASSQNPREFIQRRGRVLRAFPGKHFAHLYDAIAMPVMDDDESERGLSIISTELSRAIKFGANAENPACITDLKNIAVDFSIEYESLADGGIENDEE